MTSDSRFRLRLDSRSESQTVAIGRTLGEQLEPRTVVGLVGPLGAGKTCFSRGIASGLGLDPRELCSPSFLYLVHYEGGRLPLNHADLYRLADLPEEARIENYASLGLYEATEGEGVTVVEWWEYFRGPDPAQLVTVEFSVKKSNHRVILVFLPESSVETVGWALKRHAD
ncbi:MAG: tRNA (adenosine(37)-N6)-threonylcarbamoyltransferase complex ATPase subunit type 1 TsaE [Candidatus Binatia bacterium]